MARAQTMDSLRSGSATLGGTDNIDNTPTQPQPASRLLYLPSELRNYIYELAFTTNTDTAPVNLIGATGLSRALLSTCRQIRTEASGFYEEALPQFWSNARFLLDCGRYRCAVEDIEALDEDVVGRVTKLQIQGEAPCFVPRSFDNGIWTCFHSLYPSEGFHAIYTPRSWYGVNSMFRSTVSASKIDRGSGTVETLATGGVEIPLVYIRKSEGEGNALRLVKRFAGSEKLKKQELLLMLTWYRARV